MEGRSLVPLIRGKIFTSRPALSMNFSMSKKAYLHFKDGTIAVWEGDYKMIYYFDKKGTQLFNLRQDPYETNNLFDKEAEVSQHLFSIIQSNLKKKLQK